MSGIQQMFGAGRTIIPTSQQEYTTPGTYSWTAPANVTSVSVVCVGPGFSLNGGASGRGGALSYKNSIAVLPGTSYTVVVAAANSATLSYFISTATVSAGNYTTRTGDGGGNGGNGVYGGGGAGGYSGNGGNGGSAVNGSGTSGTGGGGGGGGSISSGGVGGGGGGGVGLLGLGASGSGRTATLGGNEGSGGSVGGNGTSLVGGDGGGYGAGAGTTSTNNYGTAAGGAVRIIWPGTTRTFPSTNTGNL